MSFKDYNSNFQVPTYMENTKTQFKQIDVKTIFTNPNQCILNTLINS